MSGLIIMKKTIVIGIDGATWNIINPLLEKGLLPNINKIVLKGVHGDLTSTIPPVTGPAWISFATGKNPGKHGCYDFIRPAQSLSKTKIISTNDIHSQCFYELISRCGLKCNIINLPGSYPPRINKTVITSLMTIGNNFIFPDETVNVAPSLKDYRIVPDMQLLADENIDGYIQDILKLENNRFECAKELFKADWDFFFVMFSGTDWMQHIMDKEYFLTTRNNNIYEIIDEYIGWFLTNMQPDTNLIIMSDHGFKSYDGIFYINEWLKKEGYLSTKSVPKTSGQSHKLKEDYKSKSKSRSEFHIPSFWLNIFARINNKIPLYSFYCKIKKILPIDLGSNFGADVPDLTKTIAYSLTEESRAIYINDTKRFDDGCVDVLAVNKIAQEIKSKLEQITIKGKKVFESVHIRNEIYNGDRVTEAPDIVLELDKYSISNSSYPSLYYKGRNRLTNNHDSEGIFMAYGADIKEGTKIESARIIDLAPTILYMFGISIPSDMDGCVLNEIFCEDSKIAQEESRYKYKDLVNKKTQLRNRISLLKQHKQI